MQDSDALLRAMTDGTRRRLLRVLSEQEMTVSELVDVLEQPQSTISRHLKMLRDAGLIVDRRHGTTTLSSLLPLPTIAANGNGHRHPKDGVRDLQRRLIEWVQQEPMEQTVQTRMTRVLARRSNGDGFFESVGSRWDQLRIDAFGDSFHWEALTSALPRHWVAADIGTGTGFLLPMLAAQFKQVIAVEPAEAMLQTARQRRELQDASHVSLRVGSLEQLPIEDVAVDLAIASLVLHHVAEPLTALKELARIVKPSGQLLIIEQTDHDDAAFSERMGDRWSGFSPEQMRQWVEEVGFADVRSHELTSSNRHHAPALFIVNATRATNSEASGKTRRTRRA